VAPVCVGQGRREHATEYRAMAGMLRAFLLAESAQPVQAMSCAAEL